MAKVKSKKLSVDFSGVEARKAIPEGDHRLKAVEAALEDGDEHPYIAWVLEIQEGTAKGAKLYDNTSLSPKALWRLRTLLEAMGIEVPEGKMQVDLDAWVKEGSEFIGTVEHENWEGKKRARLVDIMPLDGADSDDEEDEEEEEKPAKSSKKSSKAKDDDDEDGDEGEAPNFDEMDEDELEEFIDEHDLDVDLDEHKKLSKKRAAVKTAWEARDSGGDDDADEDDEDEGPTAEAIGEMGTKELAAIVAQYKLGIELDGSTKTKRRAVLKALRAKGVIKD